MNSTLAQETLDPEPESSAGCVHNSSGTKLERLDPALMTYYYGTISVLTVVNFVGNSIVLMTFYRHRDMRTPSNSFLCSLALSDMLAGLIYPVYNVSHVEKPAIKHTLGQWWVCLAIITEGTTLETCSSYGIVAIAFSRLLIISHPLRYRVYLTYRNCLVAVGLLWGTCHVVSFAAYMYHQRPRDYCNICRYEVMLPPDFNIYWDIFQFLVPLILMITANVWMAFKARSLVSLVCFMPDSLTPQIRKRDEAAWVRDFTLLMTTMTNYNDWTN
ncbi:hypothetical protein BaRGS_00015700 [Batillaria attramentaria]|uniref:G-protein coupled receptors family 1 profile domain-containing protein n=1 Tax=Batillaria attramentaria TaxID=370345 RepID=A0ABD0L1H7_9CAEN